MGSQQQAQSACEQDAASFPQCEFQGRAPHPICGPGAHPEAASLQPKPSSTLPQELGGWSEGGPRACRPWAPGPAGLAQLLPRRAGLVRPSTGHGCSEPKAHQLPRGHLRAW